MRKDLHRWLLSIAFVLAAAIVGFWLARDALDQSGEDDSAGERPPRPLRILERPPVAPSKIGGERSGKGGNASLEDVLLGRAIRFKSDGAYSAFLMALDGTPYKLLGKIDGLRAVRVGLGDAANFQDLDDLVGDDGENAGNFLVSVPEFGNVGPGSGAVGFRGSPLEWLGVSGDNSSWGEGVRIAILDTGVGPHAAFPDGVREINLLPGDTPVALNPHGTAVASLIAGQGGVTQGIAPSAELLSLRIADDQGLSNSFLLAEGIVRAVDEGAEIINISMGSHGDSALVRDAVAYAVENEVILVAASGNEGHHEIAYPAAYDGVIAVGAVDQRGQVLEFSNTGDVDLTAPGYEVLAAWGEEGLGDNRLFTGTSASAPIVAGAIAAANSEFGPSPMQNSTDLVIEQLNAAGQPGADPSYGDGILDLGRVMNSETGGIHDAAIASNYYQEPTPDDPVPRLQVTVENRGTEALTNTTVDVTINDSVYPMSVPSLRPGDTHVLTLPVNVPTTTESIRIRSALTIGDGQTDIRPDNDVATGEIILITPDPIPAPANPDAGLDGP